MATLEDLKKLKIINSINTFKEGKPILAGQLNSNFEALLQANEGFVDSLNELIAIANTAKQKFGQAETVSSEIDVETTRPKLEVFTLNRKIGDAGSNHLFGYNVEITGTVNTPTPDYVVIKFNVPSDYTGDIFETDINGEYINDVTAGMGNSIAINFDLYYEFEETEATQTYTFFISPKKWENEVGIFNVTLPETELYEIAQDTNADITVDASGTLSDNPLTPWYVMEWLFDAYPFDSANKTKDLTVAYEDARDFLIAFVNDFEEAQDDISTLESLIGFDETSGYRETYVKGTDYTNPGTSDKVLIKQNGENDISVEDNKLSNVGAPTDDTDAIRKIEADVIQTQVDDNTSKNLEQDVKLTGIQFTNSQQNTRLDNIESKNTQQDAEIALLVGADIILEQQIQDNKAAILVEKNKNIQQDVRLDSLENRPTAKEDKASVQKTASAVATTTPTTVTGVLVVNDFDVDLDVASVNATNGTYTITNLSNVVFEISYQTNYIATDNVTVVIELFNTTTNSVVASKNIAFDYSTGGGGSSLTQGSGVFPLLAKNILPGSVLTVRYRTLAGTVTLSNGAALIAVNTIGDLGTSTVTGDDVIINTTFSSGTVNEGLQNLEDRKTNGLLNDTSDYVTTFAVRDFDVTDIDGNEYIGVKNGYNETLETDSKEFVGAVNELENTKSDISTNVDYGDGVTFTRTDDITSIALDTVNHYSSIVTYDNIVGALDWVRADLVANIRNDGNISFGAVKSKLDGTAEGCDGVDDWDFASMKQLNLKADKTYVDGELATKANYVVPNGTTALETQNGDTIIYMTGAGTMTYGSSSYTGGFLLQNPSGNVRMASNQSSIVGPGVFFGGNSPDRNYKTAMGEDGLFIKQDKGSGEYIHIEDYVDDKLNLKVDGEMFDNVSNQTGTIYYTGSASPTIELSGRTGTTGKQKGIRLAWDYSPSTSENLIRYYYLSADGTWINKGEIATLNDITKTTNLAIKKLATKLGLQEKDIEELFIENIN